MRTFIDESVDDHMLAFVRFDERWLPWQGLFVPLPEADVDDLIREPVTQGLDINDRDEFKRDLACVVSAGR